MLPAILLLVACNPQGLRPIDDTGSSDDTGESGEVVGVDAAPARVVVPLGSQAQLTATGIFEGHVASEVTSQVAWLSDDSTVASMDETGVVHGLSEGVTEVFATLDGIRSPPVEVQVSDGALIGLRLASDALVLPEGSEVRVGCEGAFSDGSRGDVSHQVQWSVGADDVATVDAGVLAAVGEGVTTLTAAWSGKEAIADVSVAEGQAELSLSAIRAQTGADDATLVVTVSNDGDVDAPAFQVDLFLDAEPSAGDVGELWARVAWLGAGQSTDLLFAFPAAAGDHNAWLGVDGGDDVPEGDEDDNLDRAPFTVGASAGGPDLAVASFSYYADESWVFYAVDVQGEGSAGVGAFWIDLWYDAADDPTPSGIGDTFQRVDRLPAGQTVRADFVVAASEVPCTACTSWVMIDVNGQVPETDRDDNLAGPLAVALP